MRVRELIGAHVTDDSGRSVGWVTDVRLVRDGPVLGTFGAAFVVDGLIVTPRHGGSFFGYESSHISKPALLNWLFARLHRGCVFAPWSSVGTIDGEAGIGLRVPGSELGPPPPLD